MTAINIGCDFSDEHVETILAITELQKVEDRPHKIVGVYGTPKGDANLFGSTRPRDRETPVSKANFTRNLKRLKEAGLQVNLTVNMLFPYIRRDGFEANIFDYNYVKLAFISMCCEYDKYVDNWIMASPFLLDLFHEDEYEAGIIISTIMNVHGLRQLEEIKERWPAVNRVCPALWMNRDWEWLRMGNKIIPLELLANEFCSIGGAECDGLYRQACYLSQNMEVDWNPMKTACIQSRKDKPEAWLMARFILPQWLGEYVKGTGVQYYKVTGRTHTQEYIKYIADVYTKGKATGNLLQLWGQLEATLNKDNWEEEQKKAVDSTFIDMEDIEEWIGAFTACNPNTCGTECSFCKTKVEGIKQVKGLE